MTFTTFDIILQLFPLILLLKFTATCIGDELVAAKPLISC